MSATTGATQMKLLAWKPVIVAAVALVLMLGLHAVSAISFIDTAVVMAAATSALWWVTARNRLPAFLNRLSLAALAVAILARVIQGARWQLVVWQLVAVLVATFAGLRMWRPGNSIKLTRLLGRAALVVVMLIGSLALLMDPVPAIPAPTGEFQVGSQVFHWIDPSRAETLTADASDKREVIAQVWYPSDTDEGSPTRYVGTGAASLMDGVPNSVFEGYDDIDTHSTDRSAVSTDRDKWPVLLFSPGLSVARQSYTALSVELASRGYVVVAMSHPYDSPASQLRGGDVVSMTDASGAGTKEDQIDLRAVDSTFVLDQLHELAEVEPNSALVGHLDLDHVGILGHSFGGATAAQAVASDSRFLAGLNIDGSLFRDDIPELDRPFLWLESDGMGGSASDRDALLDGLRAGGELVKIDGSVHMSFSDYAAYFTPLGRQLVGRLPMIGFGSLSTDAMAPMTADVVAAFFGPTLNGATNGDLAEVSRRYPAVKLERTAQPR